MPAESPTIDPAGYPALLAALDLNLMESAALMTYAREWMNMMADSASEMLVYDRQRDRTHTNRGLRAGNLILTSERWDLFVEFRALYLAARAIFLRRFFEVPPT